MATGISLHIGVNEFDATHYGIKGELKGCENDAVDMQHIAESQGFISKKLLTSEATRGAVITAIRRAAFKLKDGDIFFISYSGHGGRIPDRNKDEDDLLDETWCLYDAQLIDDELEMLWAGFKNGVRVLVISDSCHSGTVLKPALALADTSDTVNTRFLPYPRAEQVYRKHRGFYDELIAEPANARGSSRLLASVRLLSGCQDNQYSYDGEKNGAFTAALKRSWDNGRFKGNYTSFHRHILAQMPSKQSPNHWSIGAVNTEFDKQQPFKI